MNTAKPLNTQCHNFRKRSQSIQTKMVMKTHEEYNLTRTNTRATSSGQKIEAFKYAAPTRGGGATKHFEAFLASHLFSVNRKSPFEVNLTNVSFRRSALHSNHVVWLCDSKIGPTNKVSVVGTKNITSLTPGSLYNSYTGISLFSETLIESYGICNYRQKRDEQVSKERRVPPGGCNAPVIVPPRHG